MTGHLLLSGVKLTTASTTATNDSIANSFEASISIILRLEMIILLFNSLASFV